MSRPRVYLTSPIHPEAQARLAADVNLDVGSDDLSREAFVRRVAAADIVLNKTDPIKMDAALLDRAPNLRLIARHGSGYSNVDVPHASTRGIVVTTTPGANAISIAEYTLGLMFASVRHLVRAANASHEGNPERLQFMGMELYGKVFGILGMGHIGKEVFRRVQGLGMRVLAYHPRPSAAALKGWPLELVSLETLLEQSDVVSVHIPLTPETQNLIARRELKRMKPTAHLLNLGRGGIVNEPDLCTALSAGMLAGYATDVLANEPVSASDPLLRHPKALVLPHIAAVTDEAQRAVAMMAVDEVFRFVKGERPLHMVNPEVWTPVTRPETKSSLP